MDQQATQPAPDVLAAILKRAAMLRPDVRKAAVRSHPDHPDLIEADFTYYTPGRRVRREAHAEALLDGRTVGTILDEWLGPVPPGPAVEGQALRDERRRWLDHTPQQVAGLVRHHIRRPPPSKLAWKRPIDQTATPEGTSPVPVPPTPRPADADPSIHPEADDEHFYTDPDGRRVRKMTRREMIDRGMTRQMRHDQYRLQGGKHPADT